MFGLSTAQTQFLLVMLVEIGVPLIITICAVLYKRWVAHTPALQHALATDLVSQVVDAVEQMYSHSVQDGVQDGLAAAKKAEAEQLAADVLAHYGIKIDPALLNVLIEAAVRSLPSSLPATTASVPSTAPA